MFQFSYFLAPKTIDVSFDGWRPEKGVVNRPNYWQILRTNEHVLKSLVSGVCVHRSFSSWCEQVAVRRPRGAADSGESISTSHCHFKRGHRSENIHDSCLNQSSIHGEASNLLMESSWFMFKQPGQKTHNATAKKANDQWPDQTPVVPQAGLLAHIRL